MKKTLTLPLTETKYDKRYSTEPMGELLEQAMAIINPDGGTLFDAKWIADQAIRAVCEEIIRTGLCWSELSRSGRTIRAPVEVTFTHFWCKRAKGFQFQPGKN
jgi:hypothetical protein